MSTPEVKSKAENPLYDVALYKTSQMFTLDVNRTATKTVLLVCGFVSVGLCLCLFKREGAALYLCWSAMHDLR